MYRSLFLRDSVADVLDRLQREMQQAPDLSPDIRGLSRTGFPALNIGGTDKTVEIFAYAPGVEPSSINVTLDRGLLTIDGERGRTLPEADARTAIHINERFEGRFRRVVTLPEDVDPDQVTAKARDGVLHISIQRRAAPQPRRISVN